MWSTPCHAMQCSGVQVLITYSTECFTSHASYRDGGGRALTWTIHQIIHSFIHSLLPSILIYHPRIYWHSVFLLYTEQGYANWLCLSNLTFEPEIKECSGYLSKLKRTPTSFSTSWNKRFFKINTTDKTLEYFNKEPKEENTSLCSDRRVIDLAQLMEVRVVDPWTFQLEVRDPHAAASSSPRANTQEDHTIDSTPQQSNQSAIEGRRDELFLLTSQNPWWTEWVARYYWELCGRAGEAQEHQEPREEGPGPPAVSDAQCRGRRAGASHACHHARGASVRREERREGASRAGRLLFEVAWVGCWFLV